MLRHASTTLFTPFLHFLDIFAPQKYPKPPPQFPPNTHVFRGRNTLDRCARHIIVRSTHLQLKNPITNIINNNTPLSIFTLFTRQIQE